MKRLLLRLTVLALCASCAVVPQNRRKYLADPTMRNDPLEDRAEHKFHTAREGASGGDGQPAGGGCGCSN